MVNTEKDLRRLVVNALRQASIIWTGRAECLKRARKKFFVRRTKHGKAIFKFHWQCAACKKYFRNVGDMEVDHIVEIGGFSGCWNEYISKMFCGQENLQALCSGCHLKKTMAYSNARLRWKRKK